MIRSIWSVRFCQWELFVFFPLLFGAAWFMDLTPFAVAGSSISFNKKARTELGSIFPNGYDALRVAPEGGFNVVDGVAAMM